MALKKETKEAIKAKLLLGVPPQDVAEEFGVAVPTVYAINQKLQIERENKAVEDVSKVPAEVVHHIIDEAEKNHAPAEIVEDLKKVADGAAGLQKLSGDFQRTMGLVLKRFDEKLADKDIALKDIKLISDTVAHAHSEVFAPGTNIHIGDNNNVSQTRLTVFKSKNGI